MDPGGQLDMQQLLAAAAQMQNQLMNAQQELAEAEVEGTAGGGLVKAVVNGQGELVDLTIASAAIDPADLEETAQTIADLVLAACRDAYDAAAELQQQTMSPFAAGLSGFGGFGGDAGPGDAGPDDAGPGTAGIPGIPGMPGLAGQPGQAGRGEPAGNAGDDSGGQPDRPPDGR